VNGVLEVGFPRDKSVPAGAESVEISTDLQTFTPFLLPHRSVQNIDSQLEAILFSIPAGDELQLFARLLIGAN
jgi:hypothetical protein